MTDPVPDRARLLAAADVLSTPCRDGRMVWHAWGSGPPLVLMHGGSGSWTHWIRNIDALAATGRRLLVPDLPGFGDSASPPSGHDADALVQPLLDGLQVLLGDAPVPVVAFSFGSLVASLAAAQAPARMAGLVLVGAPAVALAMRPVALERWTDVADPAARRAIHRRNLAALMLARPESITDEAVTLHAANLERDRLRERRMVRTDAMANALTRIRCPLAAIYGSEDAIYRGRWDDVQALLRALPGLRRLDMIEGAGHWVQYEDPAAFDAAVLACLDAVSAAAPTSPTGS
jgi:pimeloyl-ACP methyl ester carboxylesterase